MGICTANPGIQLTYGTHVLRMDTFRGDQYPRQVIDGIDVQFGATGTQLLTGPSRSMRLLWTISAMVTKNEQWVFTDLFTSWDQDRADGQAAVIAVVDETNIRPGADPIETNAVFSATPVFSPGHGADFTWIEFGLTEVS